MFPTNLDLEEETEKKKQTMTGQSDNNLLHSAGTSTNRPNDHYRKGLRLNNRIQKTKTGTGVQSDLKISGIFQTQLFPDAFSRV